MSIATTDLCDQFENDIHAGLIHVLPPVFQSFGQAQAFHGQAVTFKVFEDNTLIKKALENDNGTGKVMVIDGGASVRCALVGGNIAKAGTQNGWAGIVVDGCVRDTGEINELAIGVRALAAMPLRSLKKGAGERDLGVHIQGVRVNPGDWIYADADGIVVSPKALHE
ncbi:MAG: ribonuclease E activity regulator RraA [Burkholderiaceae bacterium]